MTTYPDFNGMEDHYDLPKMSAAECRTIHELDALGPQNDNTAIANVGLPESDLSA